MSALAQTLIELHRLATGGCGALVDHLLHVVSEELIGEGV